MLSIQPLSGKLFFAAMLLAASTTSRAQEFPTVKATRGNLSSRIVEQGEVVCRQTELMRCQVPNQGDAGAVVMWLVPEGARVKKGDLLAELDDSALVERRQAIAIELQMAEAEMKKIEQLLEKSNLALQKYRDDVLPIEDFALETDLLAANQRLNKAKRKLEMLQTAGDSLDGDLEEARVDVQLAEREVKLANMRRTTFEEYENPTKLAELRQAVDSGQVNLEIARAEHRIVEQRLGELDEQIKNCQIIAPMDGAVIYGGDNLAGGRRDQIIEEGAMVRFNQPIVSIADLSAFDISFRVHESQITQLSPGMEATIQVAALGPKELTGSIKEIATIPARRNFLTPDFVEYEVRAMLHDADAPLRPGMVAEVSVMTDSFEDVLLVPLQAVREIDGQFFCLVKSKDSWDTHAVEVAASDGRHVVIRQGLMDEEEVAMGAPEAAFDRRVILESTRPMPISPRDNPANTGTPGVIAQYFTTFDRNGNGKLEESELPTAIRRQVKLLDTNEDQVIDKEELEAWMEKRGRQR